eukprot:TRINITY_DN645_c0_g1_i7.p1 TRINITY_DN645_c0_g1~~TRINITY_DN645_c0_g1_i7.p1  ORF type:complete len:354 (+),score=70.92 TRINITY_DN645_c0_g1_i7:149-1210(+)
MKDSSDDSIFEGMPFAWKMTFIAASGLLTVFVLLIIAFTVQKSSANKEMEGLRQEIVELGAENRLLNESRNIKAEQLKTTLAEEKKLTSELKGIRERTAKTSNAIKEQAIRIPKMLQEDLYWLIGFLSSAVISGITTRQAIKEYDKMEVLREYSKKLSKEVANLTKSLNGLNRKSRHYQNFFNTTHESLIENMVTQSMNGSYKLSKIFHANKSDSRIKLQDLQKSLEGKGGTTVVLITEDDWVMAAYMNKAWQSGMYVNDETASLFSATRMERVPIKPNSAQFAGLLNIQERFLKFGLQDIIVYDNFTGTTNTSSAYQPLNQSIPSDEFFAGKPHFNLKEMHVYQHKWFDSST